MMNVNSQEQENESNVINDEFIIDFLSEDGSGVGQDKIY